MKATVLIDNLTKDALSLRNPFAFPLLFLRLICPCLKDVCYDTRVSKDCQRFFYICYSFYFVVIF